MLNVELTGHLSMSSPLIPHVDHTFYFMFAYFTRQSGRQGGNQSARNDFWLARLSSNANA